MKFKNFIIDNAIALSITANIIYFTIDLFHDYSEDPHLGIAMCIELIMMAVSIFFLINLIRQHFSMRSQIATLHHTLDSTLAQAADWKKKNEGVFKGLSHAIDEQLTIWNLTHAEKEVALLLLKGLSHKEVAELRNSAEKTVRQQSSTIYHKSGLSGRNELAAFFLEDLMLPQEKKE